MVFASESRERRKEANLSSYCGRVIEVVETVVKEGETRDRDDCIRSFRHSALTLTPRCRYPSPKPRPTNHFTHVLSHEHEHDHVLVVVLTFAACMEQLVLTLSSAPAPPTPP